MTGWDRILAAARAHRDAFECACATPRQTQLALLQHALDANAGTAFGRRHGFDEISSLETFCARVPVHSYDDLRPWIDRVAGGETGVLCAEPIIAFEETGGSTSGRKLIPYTELSLAGFRAAALPWLAELAERRPQAFAGRAYVAVSPAARASRRIRGIPVGLASEGAYLGADLAPAFASVLAAPPALAQLSDIKDWRFATLVHLLAAPDLTFISVWSPTFLTGLIEALPDLAEPLARAVHSGTYGPRDPARARTIETALSRDPIDTRLLWPRLDTVSVWADGASRPYARQLQAMLPHVDLQPKGVLATEAAITLPYGTSWPVPALMSAFLEFIDDAGRPHLCDALRQDETYRVVITSAAGLYRYDLGDRLRCRGYSGALPLLEFVGRAGIVSDLVGEKLSEPLVSTALAALAEPACLVPRAVERPFYELLVEAQDEGPLQSAATRVEARLSTNPQYAYARAIGQLGPVAARAVPDLLDRYMRAEMQRGRRLSDIKPPTLITAPETQAALTNHVDRTAACYQSSTLSLPSRRVILS